MAAGLPVVATDTPGIREVLGDEMADWLAAPGQPDGFARRIIALAGDPQKRQALGCSNAARVRLQYSAQCMLEETASILEKANTGNN
jgi:glycosyltransferase involved in cell wall biosynthesis